MAAASILAKQARDRWMREADTRWPGYGFARHKGYPSPAHLAAEAPSFKVSAIEDRAAIEVAAFREQQALEAEAREIERRKSELAKVHSDNNARRRAVSIEDEAARKQAAMKTVGESMQRDAEKARAAAEKDEADMRARGLPANV